jgi:hypothetical protein
MASLSRFPHIGLVLLPVALVQIGCAPGVPRLPAPRPDAADAVAREPADAATAPPPRPPPATPDAAAPTERPPPDAAREAAAADGAHDAGSEAAPEVAAESARPGRSPGPGDLAIDEVLIDPAGSDLGREWFEIVSLAGEALDLGSIHVADGATDVAVDAGVLQPRGVLVLGQSADTAHNGGAPVDHAYGTRLQLNNDADQIAVCAGACADGVVLARFVWTAPFGAAYQGRAVVVDGATGATCPASTPFGTEGSFGSPGAPNPPCNGEADGGADAD